MDLVRVEELSKSFPAGRGLRQGHRSEAKALNGVDLAVRQGECLALVGESGSGKTTLGRCIMALLEPSAGRVYFAGQDLFGLGATELRARRRDFQMVFQDPVSSLNPRQTVAEALSEPLEIHQVVSAADRSERTLQLLKMVGVPASAADAYPHELSGGQRQRVAIARALASEPRLLVADEPVSALDVSLRGQIVNLLIDLRQRLQLTLLFIAHDLATVERVSDRVAVMYAGKIVELSTTNRVFGGAANHPYTVSLLAVFSNATGASRLPGEPPDPSNLPAGCSFHPRCPIARDRCRREEPALVEIESGHHVSCHFPGESQE